MIKISKKEELTLEKQKVHFNNSIYFLNTADDGKHAIITGEKIARTSRGVIVKRAYDLKTAEEVAFKILPLSEDPDSVSREEKRELNALIQFRRFRGATSSKFKNYQAQVLLEGADLNSYLKSIVDLVIPTKEEEILKPIFHDMFQIAYKFCQKVSLFNYEGYLHRDIKPANMMINKNETGFNLTLIDFGGVIRIHEMDGDNSYGTHHYAAPELPGKHNLATEAFAVGKSLAEMVEILDLGSFRRLKMKQPYKSAFAVMKDISEKLCKPEPQKRITLKEALDQFKEFSDRNSVLFPMAEYETRTTKRKLSSLLRS